MCGIVAVISKTKSGLHEAQINAFTQLLYVDQVRGEDGTGIFFNIKRGEMHVKTLKSPVRSSSFIDTKEYDDATKTFYAESNFVVGHNRAATKGKLNLECTHPFKEKHIILIHNGTLLSHKELHSTYEVDSKAICHHMAHNGYKETLRTIDGAFALVWVNLKDKTLNFCRNNQRPLYIIECTTCFILASELNMGLWIAGRNNMTVSSHHIVPTETLYKFHIDDMKDYKTEKVEYYTYKYKSSFGFNNNTNYSIGGGKHKSHTLGEVLRVKASKIVTGATEYLECDIYDGVPSILPSNRTGVGYEGYDRVRIFGKIEKLRELLDKKHLKGKIESSFWAYAQTNYVLTDVEEESNIIQLPDKLPAKNHICEICNGFIGTPKFHEGMHMCIDCYEFYTGGSTNYGSYYGI